MAILLCKRPVFIIHRKTGLFTCHNLIWALCFIFLFTGIELVVRAGAWVVRAGAFSSRIELFDRCPSCPERSDWEHPGPNGRELSTSKRKPFYICNQQNMFDALRARYKWEVTCTTTHTTLENLHYEMFDLLVMMTKDIFPTPLSIPLCKAICSK
uniref:Uncharacterized protein n=1 Tax=Aegilops tauschii subsp. strangulata TaxID=200361 RepID=A0A453SH20_AEGTS